MLYPAEFGFDSLYPQSSNFAIVYKDDRAGRGVLSYRAYSRGTVIAKMTGDIVSDIRQHTLQIEPEKHLYDPYFSGFFLHSCAPNISLDMKNMLVTAVRPIQANSYLYMDYAETEDFLFRQFPCSCGAPHCRGWITGRLQLAEIPAEERTRVATRRSTRARLRVIGR